MALFDLPNFDISTYNPFGATDKTSEAYLSARENVILSEAGQEGLSGFVFDVPESEQIDLSAAITDHYVEDGSFFQDHRTIKPEIVTISGFIGELVYDKRNSISGFISSISNKLTALPAFTGGHTPQAFQEVQKVLAKARAAAALVESVASTAGSISKELLSTGSEPTKLQKAYAKLKALLDSSTLLTLQTPWNFYNNLMITAISFTRADETSGISNIKIPLKEIRIATTKVIENNYLNPFLTGSNRNAVQNTAEVTAGPTIPAVEADNKSFLLDIAEKVYQEVVE